MTLTRGGLAAAILTRANLLPNSVIVYYDTPPPGNAVVRKKGRLADPGGQIAPYVWLQLGAGTPRVAGERDLADSHLDLTAVHQFTCVAATTSEVWDLVDWVDALFFRWAPVIGGLAFGRMTPPDGFDPGPPRPDGDKVPARMFLTLQYRLDATT